MTEQRCVRGARCEDREPGVDPETGARAMLGALVEDGPLCPTCVRYCRYALGSLPWDIAELTMLLHPTMEVRFRDPDLPSQPRVKKHAPLPIRTDVEALRALIDHETQVWAGAVVDATGGTWDPAWVSSVRIGHRVDQLAALLADNVLFLISLPPERRRVYSAGLDRSAGLDPADVTVLGRDVWATRDGADAALSFLRLHRQVEAVAGRIPADRLRMPCPRCHHLALHREHYRSMTDRWGRVSQGRVVCRNTHCWAVWPDHEYEEIRTAALTAFGVRW